jgi:hypothetical protein
MPLTKTPKPIGKPKKLIKKKTKLVGWNPFSWLAWGIETGTNLSRRLHKHSVVTRHAGRSISSIYNDWSHGKGESMAARRDRRRAERGKVRCVNCTGDGTDVWLLPSEQEEHFNVHHGGATSAPAVSTNTPQATAGRKPNKAKAAAKAGTPQAGGAAMASAIAASVSGRISSPPAKPPSVKPAPPAKTTLAPVVPIKLGGTTASTVTPAESTAGGLNGVWKAPTEQFPQAKSRTADPGKTAGGDGLDYKWGPGWPDDGKAPAKPGNVAPIRPGIPQPVQGSSTQEVEAGIIAQNAKDKEQKRAGRWYKGRHRADGTIPTVADARGTGSQQSIDWRKAMAGLDIASQAMTWGQNPPESWEEEMADAEQAAEEFRGLADALRTRGQRLVEAHNIASDCVEPYEDGANILSQVGDHIMEVSTRIQAKYGELKEAAERNEVPRLEWLAAGSGAKQGTGV